VIYAPRTYVYTMVVVCFYLHLITAIDLMIEEFVLRLLYSMISQGVP